MIYSPLRYPGGKGKIAPLIRLIIEEQGLIGKTYIEPFAGGAGVALYLLENEVVDQIIINDYDKGIYSFWRASLFETDRFIKDILEVPLNIDEWKRQRDIVFNKSNKYSYELGFATFYMNRTNRSGIIKGGVIGGISQGGSWKMDARFNRENLVERISKISRKKAKIKLYNKDINTIINTYIPQYGNDAFVYFDPPYFNKGKDLYLNFFDYNDHIRIEREISKNVNCNWIITYDDTPEIVSIYDGYCIKKFDLNYCVSDKKKASELLIYKDGTVLPSIEKLCESGIKVNLRDVI